MVWWFVALLFLLIVIVVAFRYVCVLFCFEVRLHCLIALCCCLFRCNTFRLNLFLWFCCGWFVFGYVIWCGGSFAPCCEFVRLWRFVSGCVEFGLRVCVRDRNLISVILFVIYNLYLGLNICFISTLPFLFPNIRCWFFLRVCVLWVYFLFVLFVFLFVFA